jgi:hypothetical protein
MRLQSHGQRIGIDPEDGSAILCANVIQSWFHPVLSDERSYAKRGVMPSWAAQAG